MRASLRLLTCTQHHGKQRNDKGAFASQHKKGLITVGEKRLKAFALSFRAAIGDHVGKIVGEHKGTALSSNFPFQLEISQNVSEVYSVRKREKKIIWFRSELLRRYRFPEDLF